METKQTTTGGFYVEDGQGNTVFTGTQKECDKYVKDNA